MPTASQSSPHQASELFEIFHGAHGPSHEINRWRAVGLLVLRCERAGYGTPSAKDRDTDSQERAASFAGLLGGERNQVNVGHHPVGFGDGWTSAWHGNMARTSESFVRSWDHGIVKWGDPLGRNRAGKIWEVCLKGWYPKSSKSLDHFSIETCVGDLYLEDHPT